jgi:predicted peptidase
MIKNALLLTAATAGVIFCGGVAAPPAAGASGAGLVRQFKHEETRSVTLNYLLWLPKDYPAAPAKESPAAGAKRWPLMLFLHGAGERGADVQRVKVHGPSKYVATHPEFPFILVSPQCPPGQVWSREALAALVREVCRTCAVDTNRVYLTGLSMGGFGTWDLGLAHPELFAAMVPICGGGELISAMLGSRSQPQALKTLGIWAFHGAKDPVVPLSESQRMVDAAKRLGVQEVKLTIYPDAQHDSWTETYNNPELYEWLLRHERKPTAK